MDVKLIVVGGKHNGQAIPVRGPKFFIGRAEDCHLRPKSDLISRHHCAIIFEDGLLSIRDFGSKNGTLVNGESVYGEEDLENGDTLTVGPLTFTVEATTTAEATSNLNDSRKSSDKSVAEAAQRTVDSASKKPVDENEIDIADWIASEDDREVIETRTKTNILDKETLAAMLDEQSKETIAERQKDKDKGAEKQKVEGEKDDKKKKEPGRLNAMKKPKMVDSQSAAEDTLRHFFHRR